jgi:hypothetical protein
MAKDGKKTPKEFRRKKSIKDDLGGFTLVDFYERTVLQFLESLEKKGEPLSDFSKYHITAIITLAATPYDVKTLFSLKLCNGKPLMEFFRESMANQPFITVEILKRLLKHKKVFDFSRIQKGDNSGVDIIRFNLLTLQGAGLTDVDLALRVNKSRSEIGMGYVNQDQVREVRRDLVRYRKQWLLLRRKFAGKFCDPPPDES